MLKTTLREPKNSQFTPISKNLGKMTLVPGFNNKIIRSLNTKVAFSFLKIYSEMKMEKCPKISKENQKNLIFLCNFFWPKKT